MKLPVSWRYAHGRKILFFPVRHTAPLPVAPVIPWRFSRSIPCPYRQAYNPRPASYYCDDCVRFDRHRSRCTLPKHPVQFREPASYDEIGAADWGFFRRGCQEFSESEVA